MGEREGERETGGEREGEGEEERWTLRDGGGGRERRKQKVTCINSWQSQKLFLLDNLIPLGGIS